MYYLFNPVTKEIEPTNDIMKFAKWFEDPENKRVALTKIGSVAVSTVALGLAHGFMRLEF